MSESRIYSSSIRFAGERHRRDEAIGRFRVELNAAGRITVPEPHTPGRIFISVKKTDDEIISSD